MVPERFTYSHGVSVNNAIQLIVMVAASILFTHAFFTDYSILFASLAVFMLLLTAISLDQIFTNVYIFGDKMNVYIMPSQPVSLKKAYTFKRTDIARTRVLTETKTTRYGPAITHAVVLTTKDGVHHEVLVARSLEEAKRVKSELSRYRHA